jgi:hypothetical protein
VESSAQGGRQGGHRSALDRREDKAPTWATGWPGVVRNVEEDN